LLRDAREEIDETGALGLGEIEDSRALGPLSDALVAMTAQTVG